MKALEAIAFILIVIGGLNWGLVGLIDFNVIDGIFGEGSVLARIIYVVVGVAAIYALISHLAKLSVDESSKTVPRRRR